MKKKPYQSPPYLYLAQVADHCPKAIGTYLSLWRNQDKDNRLVIDYKELRLEFLISVAKFRHDCFLLVKEGLLSFQESKGKVYIELVAWDEENEEFDQ
jgi:hypothetical protein